MGHRYMGHACRHLCTAPQPEACRPRSSGAGMGRRRAPPHTPCAASVCEQSHGCTSYGLGRGMRWARDVHTHARACMHAAPVQSGACDSAHTNVPTSSLAYICKCHHSHIHTHKHVTLCTHSQALSLTYSHAQARDTLHTFASIITHIFTHTHTQNMRTKCSYCCPRPCAAFIVQDRGTGAMGIWRAEAWVARTSISVQVAYPLHGAWEPPGLLMAVFWLYLCMHENNLACRWLYLCVQARVLVLAMQVNKRALSLCANTLHTWFGLAQVVVLQVPIPRDDLQPCSSVDRAHTRSVLRPWGARRCVQANEESSSQLCCSSGAPPHPLGPPLCVPVDQSVGVGSATSMHAYSMSGSGPAVSTCARQCVGTAGRGRQLHPKQTPAQEGAVGIAATGISSM